MDPKKVRIGNLVIPMQTVYKTIAFFIFIALVDNILLRFFSSSSLLLIIPLNVIFMLLYLRSIKGEVTEVGK